MNLPGDYDGDHDTSDLVIDRSELRSCRAFYNRSMLKKGWRLDWSQLENQMKRFVYNLYKLNQEQLCKPKQPYTHTGLNRLSPMKVNSLY